MSNVSTIRGGRLPTNRIAANSYNPIAAGTPGFPRDYPVGTPVVVTQDPNFPGHVVPGDAADITLSDVVGLCANPAIVGQPVIVQTSGPITLTTAQWDLLTEQVGGLTQGIAYYLSPLEGHLLNGPPNSHIGHPRFIKRIGIALSSTDFLIDGNSTPVQAPL